MEDTADEELEQVLENEDCVESKVLALQLIAKLKPTALARYTNAVVAKLYDSSEVVREQALCTLENVDPATFWAFADAVVARLEDELDDVRFAALRTLHLRLEPADIAQYADALLARLADAHARLRPLALMLLGKMEPRTLAQYADRLLASLEEDNSEHVPACALRALGKLEPAMLTARALFAIVRQIEYPGMTSAHEIALVVMHGFVNAFPSLKAMAGEIDQFLLHVATSGARLRLGARLRWLIYGLHLRMRRIALYWYARPYKPSGPGHARDVQAWDGMIKGE